MEVVDGFRGVGWAEGRKAGNEEGEGGDREGMVRAWVGVWDGV